MMSTRDCIFSIRLARRFAISVIFPALKVDGGQNDVRGGGGNRVTRVRPSPTDSDSEFPVLHALKCAAAICSSRHARGGRDQDAKQANFRKGKRFRKRFRLR